jgi:predicted deacylase
VVLLPVAFAYHMLTEIIPLVDYAVDFHAGGARFTPQIRLAPNNPELKNLADVFNVRLLYILKSCRFFQNCS